MNESNWLTVTQFGKDFNVSRRTVYNWLAGGKLNWRRTVSGVVRIDPESAWEDYTGPRRPFDTDGAYGGARKGVFGVSR